MKIGEIWDVVQLLGASSQNRSQRWLQMQCVGLPKPEQVGNETFLIVCSGAEEALCCLC